MANDEDGSDRAIDPPDPPSSHLTRRIRFNRLTSDPEWRKSSERRRAWGFAYFGSVAILSGSVAILMLFGSLFEPDYDASFDRIYRWISIGMIAGIFIAIGASYLYWRSCRRTFFQRAMIEAELSDIREAEIRVDAKDFVSLWSVNSQRLDLYHRIATEQAEKSFNAARVATWIGFFLVALCIVVAISARSAESAVAASVLGVVGAALAGYVNRTFMRAQETAAQQLRAYFAQPLEFSRHLTAERVASDLPDGASRERAMEAVATQILKTSASIETPPSAI